MRIRVSREVADKLYSIAKCDLKEEHIRGSGPGGQHRNKRFTGVRLTHIETGIAAEATDSKSQKVNKHNAFTKLVHRLIEHWRPVQSIARSDERIRSYDQKRGTVKDHRTGVELPYKDVLDGKIEAFVTAMIKQQAEEA